MIDDDVDTRLRDHGTAWRQANDSRPGVDWDAVTAAGHKRTFIAVAAVSLALAGLVVAVVLGVGGGWRRPAQPAHGPTAAMRGAPLNFYTLSRGAVWYEFPNPSGAPSGGSDSDRSDHPVALGVANDVTSGYARTAYAAYQVRGCRTYIERHWFGTGRSSVSGTTTIAGQAVATPMAVSPDGTKLALVTTPPLPVRSEALGCTSVRLRPQQIVIVDLADKSTTRYGGLVGGAQIGGLHWAPDSRHLAYRISGCGSCDGLVTEGTRVLDASAAGHRLATSRLVLPLVGRHQGTMYGPVFWWHGRLVTAFEGALWSLNRHRSIGKAVAAGLPSTGSVNTVSSDPTGDHLLVTVGATTYRWDRGQLSVVPGQWTQPGW